MARKARRSAPRRRAKYFSMEESEISSFRVERKSNGYCLYGNELGRIGAACRTIEEALQSDAIQFGGSDLVGIDTDASLEELFEILSSPAFGVLMYNTSTFVINESEIDQVSLRNVLSWHQKQKKR